ncbi:hypothetical protein Bca4012_045182 [Brassica carinata]|uniref:Transthyretin/hydroxyisourate hydrolase domain-containing protein n=2 Tax=Brassica TaxID=3705 RepID=A0A0D3ECB4_BRAOL|nr:hypothetical protein Bca52824_057371 [Brassica carinata]
MEKVWSVVGTSATDKDGSSGPLMDLVEDLKPWTYRISFNTETYCPGGFFPYVSIAFKVTESGAFPRTSVTFTIFFHNIPWELELLLHRVFKSFGFGCTCWDSSVATSENPS